MRPTLIIDLACADTWRQMCSIESRLLSVLSILQHFSIAILFQLFEFSYNIIEAMCTLPRMDFGHIVEVKGQF